MTDFDSSSLQWDSTVAKTLRKFGMPLTIFRDFLIDTQQNVDARGYFHESTPIILQELRENKDLNDSRLNQLLYNMFGELYRYMPSRLAIRRYSEFYFYRQRKLERIIAQRIDEYGFTRDQYDTIERFVQEWCESNTPFRALRKLKQDWWNFIEDDGEFNKDDLEIYGSLNYLCMQGPHCALIALDGGRSDDNKDYSLLLDPETEDCPMETEKELGRSFFGPVVLMRKKDDTKIACKKVNLKRVFNNIRRGMRRKDNPQNEVPTHQYIAFAHGLDQPNTPERCPYIAGYEGACLLEEENTLYYYQEYGNDYFAKLTTSYKSYVQNWIKVLKKEDDPHRFKKTSQSPWERDRAREWLMQVKATYDMHQMGIAHRDIKLENVVCDEDGNTKCIDFGVAYRFGIWEKDDMYCRDCVGTAPYMSPECFVAGKKKRAADCRLNIKQTDKYSAKANDVWCLGVMLFCMLVQEMPYQQVSVVDPCFTSVSRGLYLLSEDKRKQRLHRNPIMKMLQQKKRHMMITDSVIDLFYRIFVPEDQRICLEAIFDHPWVQEARKSIGIAQPTFPSTNPLDAEINPLRQRFLRLCRDSPGSDDIPKIRQKIIDLVFQENAKGHSANFIDTRAARCELIRTGETWLYVRNGVPKCADATLSTINEKGKLSISGTSLGMWSGDARINVPSDLIETVNMLIQNTPRKPTPDVFTPLASPDFLLEDDLSLTSCYSTSISFGIEELDGGGLTLGALATMKQITSNAI